jgi:hypothetical protein
MLVAARHERPNESWNVGDQITQRSAIGTQCALVRRGVLLVGFNHLVAEMTIERSRGYQVWTHPEDDVLVGVRADAACTLQTASECT